MKTGAIQTEGGIWLKVNPGEYLQQTVEVYDRLEQQGYWANRQISAMTFRHRENSLKFLVRNAESYRRLWSWGKLVMDIFDDQRPPYSPVSSINFSVPLQDFPTIDGVSVAYCPPEKFIRSTPVYRALWEANYGPIQKPALTPLERD